MTEKWAKEKEWRRRRGEKFKAEMEAAIEARNVEAYQAAFVKAIEDVPGKERKEIYYRFLRRMTENA